MRLFRRTVAGTFRRNERLLSDYRSALDEIRRRELTRALPTDVVWRLFGTGFALEQFRRDLDDLFDRTEEFSSGHKRAATG